MPTTAVFARTLTVAGFVIEEYMRDEDFATCHCHRANQFGVAIPYLIAITERSSYSDEAISDINSRARAESRVPMLIAQESSPGVLGWREFLEAAGGPVPSWRALAADFATDLRTLATNQLPPNHVGEAWQLFELAVNDAFEYLLGRRVRRLGAKRRGKDVPDAVCETPDKQVLVLDSKASANKFSVTTAQLRPLREYVERQVTRQTGQLPVSSAIVIASDFEQDVDDLLDACNTFLSDTRVPLCLVTVDTLVAMVDLIRDAPTTRNAIQWSRVFSKVGLAREVDLSQEITRVNWERIARGA